MSDISSTARTAEKIETEMPYLWRIVNTIIDRLNNSAKGQELADEVLAGFHREGLLTKENERDIKMRLVRRIFFTLANTHEDIIQNVLEEAALLYQKTEEQ